MQPSSLVNNSRSSLKCLLTLRILHMPSGILHSLNRTQGLPTESISNKVKALLRDDQVAVRVKAANALGYMFGDIA